MRYSYLIFLLLNFSCKHENTLFETISSSQSAIHFNNKITESDTINQLDVENIYNGGGVGIGDFNNDGLPDIFFTGNIVPSKLYLNNGNFSFTDITAEAKINTSGKWCRGVAVIDINNDGRQDIYVSATLRKQAPSRKNLLYINLGSDSSNIPVFREMAAGYGLDDDSHTTQADFFDYDNDGDLDVYLVVNEISPRISPYLFRPIMKNGTNPSTGKLLRNDWSDSLKHPLFRDVSREAGIQTEGYGHSAVITDINNDGWKDIYISNDFITNDLLWINNHDGTFTDQVALYFKHTSANSMGCDAGDINNDGLEDYITLDMNPEDNYRKKMMLSPISYQLFQNYERFGYSYQYVRNTLQLNQGPRMGQNDSIGVPIFSEIGYFAGIEATDWSWIPVLTDFDNDGYRDLIINNGFPRDITDHDFAMFREKAYQVASKDQILMQVPEVKLHNYAFRNNGDLSFTDVSHKWGMSVPTFSNGSACADLDQDGDLDLVINNINDEALLYRNNAREQNMANSHFLRVQLKGTDRNIQGLGARIEIHYDNGKKQAWENSPFRGYLSTFEDIAHFGLGSITEVDSLVIKWQNGRMQVFRDLKADQLFKADIAGADADYSFSHPAKAEGNLFTEVTASVNINFTHKETDFVDFNIQKLLPHKFSEYGPALASGDIDGNGLDDIICGGSSGNSSVMFFQQPDGKFIQKDLLTDPEKAEKLWDDTGILLFDADGDSDPDLYIASGGFENEGNTRPYRDHFYLNDGKGRFTENSEAIPENLTSKFCVRASDFDRDGDLDLFIAGRVDPWTYPKPVSSCIYRNDSQQGNVKFTDITKDAAPDLGNIGLVCDAIFTDYDNDGWSDLILAGEWMPVTVFKNSNGVFRNMTSITGISDRNGLWNSISAGDFDNDGDIDYILGNLGLNSYYRADKGHPISIYAADFDNNGSYDAFPALYLPSSQQNTSLRSFPAHGRDDAVKQMISMRSKFQNYKSYAISTIEQLFSKEQLTNSMIIKADYLKSSFCRNEGNNKFTLVPLPIQAQISALNGMAVDDFDGDGNLDVIINGNDWGTEVTVGRYDALNGLLLSGDGKGNFTPLSILQSGIYIPGNGKGMVGLRSSDNRYMIAAGVNRGPLKIFSLKKKPGLIPLQVDDISAELEYKNGTRRKQEFYFGSSFLSQSARFMTSDENINSVTITNTKGISRKIEMNNGN
ncbi:MAG: VCBS repeat-containing protein [Bacteroidales bacterium]|nr:VCBS repeat-containing protein [Bacteroidales bacterium]